MSSIDRLSNFEKRQEQNAMILKIRGGPTKNAYVAIPFGATALPGATESSPWEKNLANF